MKLPKCESFVIRTDGGLQGCEEPAEYCSCDSPRGGPVCFEHACKRCSGNKDGRKLSFDELLNARASTGEISWVKK